MGEGNYCVCSRNKSILFLYLKFERLDGKRIIKKIHN